MPQAPYYVIELSYCTVHYTRRTFTLTPKSTFEEKCEQPSKFHTQADAEKVLDTINEEMVFQLIRSLNLEALASGISNVASDVYLQVKQVVRVPMLTRRFPDRKHAITDKD